MAPGVNLTLALGVLLFVILNANTSLAVLGFALGKVLCLLLAPTTFQIGYFLIHHVGLEDLFRWLLGTAVLAMLDLQVYCLIGGLPVALIVGGVFGWLTVRLIMGLRRGMLAAQDKSGKLQAVGKNIFARLLLRLVFGKLKVSMAKSIQKKPPLLRKGGLIVMAILILVVAAGQLLMADYFFKKLARSALETAVGAEANIDEASLSISGGSIEIRGLQITDRDKPTHNLFQAASLIGDISVSDMLAKRFVAQQFTAGQPRTGMQRSSPGEVFRKEEPDTAPDQRADTQEGISPEERSEQLLGYFEGASKHKKYLEQAKDFLEKRKAAQEQKAQPTKEALLALAANEGYLSLSAEHLLAKRPTWTIRRLSVEEIVLQQASAIVDLNATELSGQPELNDKPMTIELADADGFLAKLVFDFTTTDGRHTVKVVAPRVPVGGAIRLSDNSPLAVRDASVSLRAEGWFNSDALSVQFAMTVKNLQARTQKGKGFLGMDQKTSERILGQISQRGIEFGVYGTVVGDLGRPRLIIDRDKSLGSLHESLKQAGLAEVAKQLEPFKKKAEKITKDVSEAIEEKAGIKLPGGTKLPGGIKIPKTEGLFGGKKKNAKEEPATKPTKPAKPRSILNDLLGGISPQGTLRPGGPRRYVCKRRQNTGRPVCRKFSMAARDSAA